MRAVEPDEAGAGDDAEACEAPGSLLEEDHLLRTSRTHGLHQTSPRGELLPEGPGDGGKRRGDHDGVVGGVLGEAIRTVVLDYLGVRHAEPGEILLRCPGHVREAL